MLIKYPTRLTLDCALGLNSFLKNGSLDALQAVLEFARANPQRAGALPFPEKAQEACRFFSADSEQWKPMTFEEALSRLTFPLKCTSPYMDLRSQPESLEQFLQSQAHHELAFDQRPPLDGYSGGKTKSAFTVYEGRTGRKYARTKEELLAFFTVHPDPNSIYSEIQMRTGEQVENLDALESYIDRNEKFAVDWLLDLMGNMKGYLFELHPPEISSQEARILELNSKSQAALDFVFWHPSENHAPVFTSLTQAKANLESALTQITAFAKKANVEGEAVYFKKGLEILRKGTEVPPLWASFGASVEAGNLHLSALTSDFFAGMASWNDVQIEQNEEFHRVSNNVVLCIIESLCASVTS